MDKQKEVIDDVDVEWTSTDSSDNSSDDELVSTIRRSRLEHEYHQSRRGAETSSEAEERNQPATTSGEEILSIPPIARLTKPPRRLSVQSFLRMSNPRSVLTENDLSEIRGRFEFPNEVQLRLPTNDERAYSVSEGRICMYTIYFESGLRLPLPPLLIQCMQHYQLAIPQLMPNGMRVFLGLIVLSEEADIELSVDDVLAIYYPQENSKDHGRYSMYPRRKKQVVGEMKNADRYWQDRYFFMHVNKKSMGDLANYFYPLWGTLRKELKKPPPKALLFEEKLERLLALPNREWDDIQVPKRLGASSLWKDFVELPSSIPKRVPSWVDWPFIIRGALRRLFGTLLFVDPLIDEEALIVEFALDLLVMEPSSPPTKKRKVVEKAKRKILAKRNKRSKVATPELDVERPKVEVALPPRLELLRDQQASVEIMNQLLFEADTETLGQGPLLGHMDYLLWDGLKTNIRAMGLIKRTNDKNLKQRTRIRELEAINKNLEERDRRRGEMLLDIERKFADVKTSADGLNVTLKEIMHEAKEGTSMMEVMVDRFDEAQAKIKSLEAKKAVLATQILDAFEKATIKARYDLLKQYKQGLFVDAEIEEELDLWKDEIEGPSSAPAITIEPTSNDAGKSGVERPAHEELLEDREQRQ
ncbi:hypothetical protein TIFTF001_043852 [Ficus carica]|uniref:Transposase (putative) gypsy type domain-containing protein n=1 Tax=Ficus carica TaxID=3494 RepID=A0AA87Z611_FICCA|nr:hypothetical protein TIFTF001_043846 [Ficus carica]GMN25039.1 hypothetical protein TIFTF001_043847 [Ficus carica]GMN25065.1 hypothetical protein TIFTF001_043851 [Ficus carica]GMN25077.1 hypothetical protein TIFTF001_043852 [Ficus carica]